MIAAAFTQSKL